LATPLSDKEKISVRILVLSKIELSVAETILFVKSEKDTVGPAASDKSLSANASAKTLFIDLVFASIKLNVSE
jgi:hypothetical protein